MVAMVNHVGAVSGATGSDDLTIGFDMPEGKSVEGKHILVGVDIDTTGRRLIDEIVQLAAYSPNSHFEQYIMPYMNLNPAARQRHQVRVISIGFYRMLKSMHTYKIIKSKSEIAAIKDFLDWLDQLKASDPSAEGIILVYHEERKFIPYMILESLKKYNLLDRFCASVKSFVNSYHLIKDNEALKRMSLRKLARELSTKVNNNLTDVVNPVNTVSSSSSQIESDATVAAATTNVPKVRTSQNQERIQESEMFEGNASVRAKLAYDVAIKLCNQNMKEPIDSLAALEKLMSALHPFAKPMERDINELQTQNQNLERQNSFRPVFLNYFKTTLYHRVRAVKFRIILAEQGYDLLTLSAIWGEKQKDGINEVLTVIDELKTEDRHELVELLDSYFDPNKTTIKPIMKSNSNRRRNRRPNDLRGLRNENGATSSRSSTTEQGAGGDKQAAVGNVPDSTTKLPTHQPTANGNAGAKAQRAKRNQRQRQNSAKSQTSSSSVNVEPTNNVALGGAVAAPAAVAVN